MSENGNNEAEFLVKFEDAKKKRKRRKRKKRLKKKLVYSVSGMTCGKCERIIGEAIQRRFSASVSDVSVNRQSGILSFELEQSEDEDILIPLPSSNNAEAEVIPLVESLVDGKKFKVVLKGKNIFC